MKQTFDRVVAIDTQILIHANRTNFKNENERILANRCRRLMNDISNSDSKVCISIITLGEYLTGVKDGMTTKVATDFQEKYQIAQYNIRAAIENSKMMSLIKPLISERGDRKVLSADAKILASIIVAPCHQFFTYDDKFFKLAQSTGKLRVCKVPDADLLDGLE